MPLYRPLGLGDADWRRLKDRAAAQKETNTIAILQRATTEELEAVARSYSSLGNNAGTQIGELARKVIAAREGSNCAEDKLAEVTENDE